MAKNKKTSASSAKASSGKGEQGGFIAAGIMLLLFSIIIMLLIINMGRTSSTMNQNSQRSQACIDQINSEVLRVNENVLEIVGGIGSSAKNIEEISLSFRQISALEAQYESIGGHSDAELRRYDSAKKFTEGYHQKLLLLQNNLGGLNQETMRMLYQQEIAPIAFTSTELFEATVDLNALNVRAMGRQVAMVGSATMGAIAALVVLGEIGIFVASRIAAKRREDLEKRTQQAEAAANKFKHSQQKMADLATTNILTNMKNRYALENDITERLETDQFNIALFDMDQFRSINDNYGYDFGDEYLAQIAEKLRSDFSQFAEIYNITGNTFAFVFNREISDAQAEKLSGSVIMNLAAPFSIANLTVALTASGAVYHYLPGDCMNLSGVLVRLDNQVRNAKMQGGNRVLIVNQM
ncbi:MAG: GGDEF domain-containing protein [Oscillospiraceae bacterium]|nr:GGDEF domain-containing protein [Oscillospiraceae bacterium]